MSTVIAAGVSHVGRVREHNEDAFLAMPDEQMFMVADGMGGHAAGEVASSIAVNSVRDRWRSPMLDRQRDPTFKQSLTTVRDKIKSGTALSDAFAAEGELYPPIFPASLGSGMPGCWLWTEILLLGTAPTDATGGAQVGLPIPNDPGLADKAFYVQWFVVDAAANPAGLSTSPGGAVVVR